MKLILAKEQRRVTGLQAVSLEVSDFDRAVAFYHDTLGLKVEVAAPGHYATIPQVNISLVALGGEVVSEGFHIELVVNDVDAWYHYLAGRGVTLLTEPKDQPWGARNFYLRDPDGHKLELTSPAP